MGDAPHRRTTSVDGNESRAPLTKWPQPHDSGVRNADALLGCLLNSSKAEASCHASMTAVGMRPRLPRGLMPAFFAAVDRDHVRIESRSSMLSP